MTLYLINVVLAVIWAVVTGSFTLVNLVFGFVLGAFALYLTRDQIGTAGYVRGSRHLGALTFFFLREMMLSAWRVATLVLAPKLDLKPGIFAFPLTARSDIEITLLANMITLTPGTLSIDVSEDRSTLYVHALECSNAEGLRRDIAEGFERRIRGAFR
ncbi:Na+/H+ antiporter subunit E [Aureimonas sp. SA4125]|uniref:Na+/H+ antiporter subunit E n=1 Tax=Aureimonas sp. SA4125 TaxID=2826993 RepID=UPI001CC4ABD8|nr:Na+/H+ antiporter subunit E [Aureimonas sp. SA4125]BDA85987.1 Na+/H+ antiporter subunit E [Aureimonas sp. SA4125]